MKMGKIEKIFVNSESHSHQVSRHFERLLQKIEVQSGQTYLDVGCGNGAAPIYIAKNYPLTVTGIDVDPDQIRLAQAQSEDINNVRFLTQDGTRLPFGDGEFDIVATNKVTHHIPNWQAVFVEMLRVLKPGGYFIYADLIVPSWVARVGQAVIKNRAGFPTKDALDSLTAAYCLTRVHRATTLMSYEAVLQKAS